MSEVYHAMLVLASAPPYGAGYLVGILARAGLWIAAAFVAGYRSGRGFDA